MVDFRITVGVAALMGTVAVTSASALPIRPSDDNLVAVYRTISAADERRTFLTEQQRLNYQEQDQIGDGMNQTFQLENRSGVPITGIMIDFTDETFTYNGVKRLPVIVSDPSDLMTSTQAFRTDLDGNPVNPTPFDISATFTPRARNAGTYSSKVTYSFTDAPILDGQAIELNIGDLDSYVGDRDDGRGNTRPSYDNQLFDFDGTETVMLIFANGTTATGFFHEGQGQELGTVIYFTNTDIIPLPASVLLLMSGLGGIALMRRRVGAA